MASSSVQMCIRDRANPNVDFEDLCAQLRMYQASLRTCFTLENFDNLIKNGRMRPLVGTLLHSLGIHVIADATPQGMQEGAYQRTRCV